MGELKGKQIQPRDIASICYAAGWTDAVHLCEAVQVCLAESQGYDRAINDNLDSSGKLVSRDIGVFQINIPADQVGTDVETKLYTVKNNVVAARDLYERRGWQPWVAWNSKICFRDTYIKRAVRGVGNFLAELALTNDPDPDANPRYLTNPVLDYTYRVTGQTKVLREAHLKLIELKQHTDDPNDKRIAEIVQGIAAGISIPKSSES